MFAVPAALAYIARPLVWVGIGTAAAAGVAVGVVAAVAVVAVVLVGAPGNGEPSAVVRPPAATSEATSTPPPTPTVAPATAAPTASATPAPSPTPTPIATPTPEPGGPVLRYDRFDPTGEASTPGSYAFLMLDGDTTRVVETYEELRTESTVMRVHTTDADGVSHAAFYDGVAVGDVVEWLQAEDCWARYLVTTPPAGVAGVTRDFQVRWLAYTYAGCAGAISTAGTHEIGWSPADIRSPEITVPIRYGPWLLVPYDWEGEIEGAVRYAGSPETIPPPPSGEFSTSDIVEARRILLWREPSVPTGWTFEGATQGAAPTLPYHGYVASYINERGSTAVAIIVAYESWQDSYLLTTYGTGVIHEATRIDGHPAVLEYAAPGVNIRLSTVQIFDEATGIVYVVLGHDSSLWTDIEGTIAIARSLLRDTPGADDAIMRYNSFDPTGEASTPGSYAFLMLDGDTTRVVETYEELRTESTAMRVHTTDADGVSHTAFYDGVEVGDVVEWREASDCWTRYQVTSTPAGVLATPTQEFGVEWMTYAFTGCGGTIRANTAASVDSGPLPDLGGTSLGAPVVHGPFQIVPGDWTGEVKWTEIHPAPGRSSDHAAAHVTSLAAARALPYWRDLHGWTLRHATSGGTSDPVYGYCARFETDSGDAVEICGGHAGGKYGQAPSVQSGGRVTETRSISGFPVLVNYLPAGLPQSHRINPIRAYVYDRDTDSLYEVSGLSYSLRGTNVERVLGVVRSLLAGPTP